MAGIGGPPGNNFARNALEWKQAINRALEKRGNGDRSAALDALAERFLDAVEEMASGGENVQPSVNGFRELGDRLDGKAAQTVALGGDPDGVPLQTQVIVNFPKP